MADPVPFHDRAAALLARIGLTLFRALPVDRASALGGAVARLIGPRLKVHRIAERNLRRALPALTNADIDRILTGMWDNLGRNVGELAHFETLRHRIDYVGQEHLAVLKDDEKPAFIISGHYANWEVLPLAVTDLGIRALGIYRAANNPIADALIQELRATSGQPFSAKGQRAARDMLRTLRNGGNVALLIDQKQNDGIPVPFFGRDAMTPPAIAEIALRFKCPIVPMRVDRLGGAYFRVTAYAPFVPEITGDHKADVMRVMRRVNGILEEWITERPEQWFWVHRRWPD